MFYTGVKLGLRGGSNKKLKTLQNEELLLSSLNIIREIKLRRMTKGRHVTRIAVGAVTEVRTDCWWESLKESS